MHSHWHKIAIGVVIVLVAIIGVGWMTNWFGLVDRRPALATVPPLAPLTRSSTIVMPVAISHTAIRDFLEKEAPAELSGKADFPRLPLLANMDVGWSVSRSPFTVANRTEGLAISTALTGSMRGGRQPGGASESLPGASGNLQNLLGSLFRGNAPSPDRQEQTDRISDQRADIRGSATLIARPVLLPQWRMEPNLTSEVTVADASFSIMGMRLSVPDVIKPLMERGINEQVSLLQAAMRNDPSLELTARQEWAKMCRSVSLGAIAPDLPRLWLEVRPTRAFAAHPRFDSSAVNLTVGVQAETRIVPNETKPDCPFPAQLDIVQQAEQGRIAIAVPIDVPFTEVDRLVGAQLKGKTFPEDKSGAFTATIQSVNFAASGDRLLISVGLRANETKTWFGFGANATIHVWGRPVLDRARQMLRFNDLALDVESEAAFGMLGVAARTAMPYLVRGLEDHAVVDLAPIADGIRKNMAGAVTEFRKRTDSVRVDAEVVDLRLVDLAFDAKTLRIIAEADGTVRVAVTKLDQR
jgi:Domain of unknown function (DUF4403)